MFAAKRAAMCAAGPGVIHWIAEHLVLRRDGDDQLIGSGCRSIDPQPQT